MKTFCSLLARCRIPCAYQAKRHPNVQKCSEPLSFLAHDFDMCFAPQRRTLLTSKGAPNSEALSFFNFWLRNVLHATTACNFLSLIWPHGSAPAALASPQIIEKRNVSRLSYLFAHLHLLYSDSLSFSDSSHLCFSIGPYCRKFDF